MARVMSRVLKDVLLKGPKGYGNAKPAKKITVKKVTIKKGK